MLYQLVIGFFVAVNSQVTGGPPFACPNPFDPLDNCVCTYGECTWSGDPHQTTFDNFHYHFQGDVKGEYKYISSCTSDEQKVPFQLIAQHDECSSTPWNQDVRCTSKIIIRLYDRVTGILADTVTISPGWSVTNTVGPNPIGSGNYAYGTSFPQGGYSLDVANRVLRVYTGKLCTNKEDLIIEDISGFGNLRNMKVRLNQWYFGMVCGLCGYWNDISNQDFLISADFANSPYPICLYQTQPTISSMTYSDVEAANVNIFGEYWRNVGNGIRRLLSQDFQFQEIDEIENQRRQKAYQFATELFPQGEKVEFFFDDCADDARFICRDITEDCVFEACTPLLGEGDSGISVC